MIKNLKCQWRVNRVFQTNGANLWLASYPTGPEHSSKITVADPITVTMRTLEHSEAHAVPPTLELDHTEVQSLIDELWSAGFRPTGIRNASEVVQAKDAHLDDLRKALFAVLPSACPR